MDLFAWVGLMIAAGWLISILGVQTVGPAENRRRLRSVLGSLGIDTTIGGTWTSSGTATVTAVTNVANLRVGMLVTGGGVSPGTTISEIVSSTSIVLSSAATTVGSLIPFSATNAPSATTAKIHLYAAPFSGGVDPTPASFTEATFDSYLPLAVTTTPVFSNPDFSAEADSGDLSWVLIATPTTGNTIYGYWIDYVDPTDGVTVVVAFWEPFAVPLPMNVVGNAVVCSVPFKLPLPGTVSQP